MVGSESDKVLSSEVSIFKGRICPKSGTNNNYFTSGGTELSKPLERRGRKKKVPVPGRKGCERE